MKTVSTSRTFTTPPLEEGQLYYYIVRAEVSRDGKTWSDTKRVIVKAGSAVRATFSNLDNGATATTEVASGR